MARLECLYGKEISIQFIRLFSIVKLLFENWRNYRKKILEQISDERLGFEAEGYTIESMTWSPDEAARLLTTSRRIAAIVDPTGILSWPEFLEALETFERNPTLWNAGKLALATLAVIPGAGLLAAPAKIGRLTKLGSHVPKVRLTVGAPDTVEATANIAKMVSRELARVPGGKKMSLDLRKEISKVNTAMSSVKTASKVSNVLTPAEKYASLEAQKQAEIDKMLSTPSAEAGYAMGFEKYQALLRKPGYPNFKSRDVDFGLATQGTKPGSGRPSQVFKTAEPELLLGRGVHGIAMRLDNGHVLKLFGSGQFPGGIEAELEGYAKLLNSQHAGTAKPSDLAVYEFGTIPTTVTRADKYTLGPAASRAARGREYRVMTTSPPPAKKTYYLGYAEMGYVRTGNQFRKWLADKVNGYAPEAADIETFLLKDLRDSLKQANRPGWEKIKSFSEIAKEHGGARRRSTEHNADLYVKYVLEGERAASKTGPWWKGVNNGALAETVHNTSIAANLDRLGWKAAHKGLDRLNYRERAQSAAHLDPSYRSWADLPDVPDSVQEGIGQELLFSFLKAVYRVAEMNGGEYLFGPETADIHIDNFGIAPTSTGAEVIIFDR